MACTAGAVCGPAAAQDPAHIAAASRAAEAEALVPETPEEKFTLKRLSVDDLETFKPAQNGRSAIERAYSRRIIDDLAQFGYDLFNDAAKEPSQEPSIPAGAVQDDYILSAGDRIDMVIRGQENTRQSFTVDNQGLLVIDNFTPLAAAGQSLGTIRAALEQEAALMHNTQVFVSLAAVRQIHVLVVGHVIRPGSQTLTAFHTTLDALRAAGGIEKTGSLRQVKLVRRGRSVTVDLYDTLMGDSTNADTPLQDGDRIIVPPLGATIAAGGTLKRPGIYELDTDETLTLEQVLSLSGGVLTPGDTRFVKLAVTARGEETVQDIDTPGVPMFGDGSILMVMQAETARGSDVTLSGHTRRPGTHDLRKAQNLGDLIGEDGALGSDIYPLIGVIERRDAQQFATELIEFSPLQVVHGLFDRRLQEGDKVHLFSAGQIHALEKNPVTPEGGDTILHEASYKAEIEKGEAGETIADPVLASFLRERAAFVRGAVRRPGAYPVADGTMLDSVLAIAGGTTLEANTSKIEVTSRLQGEGHQQHGRSGTRRINVNFRTDDPGDILIGPGDTVRVNQKFHRIEDQSVTVIGEVNHPGRYDLMPGDTVLSLMERAGGLTEQAYAPGAIFSRASERRREESRYKAQARDLEMKLAASLQQTDDDKKPDLAQIQAVQTLISQLDDAEPVGRITVEADPAALTANPDQNMLLEAGDRVYIPKRPLNVRVSGEVLSPAALQFRQGKEAEDYIRESGGLTYFADGDRSFVMYPDGSARPLRVSSWQHESSMIPPGSTIVVPRDPKPYDFLEGAERISQILANLAVSGLYLEALSDDED